MIGRWSEWLIVVLAGAAVSAAAFALTAEPLAPINLFAVPFWVASAIILVAGFLGALVLVDLKRAFLAVPGMGAVATILYALAIWSPAAVLGHYSTHLLNYAMVQSVLVSILTVVLAAIGALAGTVVNTSVREYDL